MKTARNSAQLSLDFTAAPVASDDFAAVMAGLRAASAEQLAPVFAQYRHLASFYGDNRRNRRAA